jgi:hypothetical protein
VSRRKKKKKDGGRVSVKKFAGLGREDKKSFSTTGKVYGRRADVKG